MTLTYRVDGMSCEHCKVAVTDEVGGVAGVASVDVDLGSKLVRVSGAGHRRRRRGRGDRRGRLRRGAGMSAPLKLLGFAAVLALVFGVATVAGGAVGPDRADDAAERADTPAGHGEGAEPAGTATAATPAGTPPTRSAASPSPTTACGSRSPRPRSRAARATTLRFTIDGADGPVRDFEVEHEKRMHLIVVRRDGTGFQHLHPTMAPDGTWSTPVTLPDAGAYRVFADFKRGENETLAADLTVDGDADYRALPERTDVDTTDGYTRRDRRARRQARLRHHARRQARRDRALPRRRRPPGRAARGRSRLPARAPGRRARRRVRDRARPRLALPPVPAVQARGPGPHRGVHAMSAQIELPITGMTCASCANRIERKLNKLEGVDASVNYATEKATVSYDPEAVAARGARGRGRGRRLPGGAAVATSRRVTRRSTRPPRCASG